MNTLLHIGLSNALAASLLALLALLVGSLVRRPALTHALWLLVLLKLLTPPLVWIPVPWPATAEAPAAVVETEAAPEPPLPAPVEANPFEAHDVPTVQFVAVAEAPGEPHVEERGVAEPTANPPEPVPAPSVAALVAVWWLGGSLVWLALALVRLSRFRRLLRFARPAASALQERTCKLAEHLGLRRCPGVYLLPGRLAPMIWAAGGRPRLLLPDGLAEQMEEEALDTLLLHELAHLRRRDHWVRGLELVVLALYWWHPFVWLARRELREAEEQCCDAWVVAALPGSGRTYATALVDALDFLSAAPVVPPLATGLGQVSDLKRRLTMIMRGTTPRTLNWSGCMAVLAVAALLPLLPTWAQAQQKPAAGEEKSTTPAEREDLRSRRFRIVVEGEDLNKAQANLERLEAELKLKLAEVEAARARLKNAGRIRNLEGAGERRNVRYVVTEVQGGQKKVWYVPVQEPAPVAHFRVHTQQGTDIEIIGLDDKPEVRKKIIDLLKKALPTGRRVIIVGGGGLEVSRLRTQPMQVEIEQGRPLPPVGIPARIIKREPGAGERPVKIQIGRDAGLPEKPVMILRPGTVESLQKQLEELRREVEKLKTMKRSKPARPEANNPAAEEIQRLKDQLKHAQAEALKARDLAEQQHLRAAAAEQAARAEAERALQQLKLAEQRLEEARRARAAKEGVDSVKPRKP